MPTEFQKAGVIIQCSVMQAEGVRQARQVSRNELNQQVESSSAQAEFAGCSRPTIFFLKRGWRWRKPVDQNLINRWVAGRKVAAVRPEGTVPRMITVLREKPKHCGTKDATAYVRVPLRTVHRFQTKPLICLRSSCLLPSVPFSSLGPPPPQVCFSSILP